MEIIYFFVSNVIFFGMMLIPLVVPFFGFRWTKRKYGKRLSNVFLMLLVAISAFGIIYMFLYVRDLADEGAWTAAAIAPLGLVFVGFPVMLVVTIVWMAALSTWNAMRSD